MTRHLVRFGLYLVIGYSYFGSVALAQTPSKEYIRVNGRVVAIESTATNTACAATQTALPFRGTGTATGSGVLNDATVDPNWILVSNPANYGGASGTQAIVFTSSYGGSTPNSKPINAIGSDGAVPAGAYVFRQKLDLSCHNPSTVSIGGAVQADDNVQIYVNGKFQSTPSANWYTSAAFSISGSSGAFVQGWNYIDFVLTNIGDPGNNSSMLRVDVTSATATVDSASNGLKFELTTNPPGGNRNGNTNLAVSSGTQSVTWAMEAPVQGSLSGVTSTAVNYTGPGVVSNLTVGIVKATSTTGNPAKTTFFPIWMNPEAGGSITISGTNTNLAPFATRVFSATVSGAPAGQDTVRWSVVSVPSPSSSNGSISTGSTCVAAPATMTYQAPSTISTAGNIVLKAESCFNASWNSTISIAAAAATSVTVAMSPKPTTVNVSQTFTALVSNADTPGVTWSVSPASAGTITSAGVYTVAAGYTGNATVTARSIENTAVSDPHTFAASSSAPSYQSSLVSFVMPSSLTQGGPFTSTITMQNPAGGAVWDTSAAGGANQVVIASQTPANNLTWRTNTGTTPSTSVTPNNSAVFTVTGRAPVAVTGIQTFDWQMRQGAANWFGPIVRPAASVSVGAGTKNSQITQFTAPTTINVGETFNATVTMQNTGSATWWSAGVSGTNPFRLINTGANPSLWVTSLMQLPTEFVDNAQTTTFTIPATAPDDPGTKTFSWQMEQSGLGTFGAIASQSIEVKSINPTIRNVTPTSGSGLEQLFSAKFIGGQAQTHTMRFHFWPNDGTAPHCWAEYNRTTNQIIIYNSSTGVRQFGTPGVIQTIENEYCYVRTGESTVGPDGNVTQVGLKIGFKSTMSGTKNFYVSMVNTANVDTGWLYQGTWVIPQQVLVTVSPTSALLSSGQSQQFSSTVTGSANTAVSWTPFGWGSVTAGGFFTASTVTSTQNTILRATSQADNTKSADANLTIQPAPVLVTVTNFYPQNGSGRYATFNVSANGGNAPISNIQFYANTTQLNTGGCLVTWYPSSNYVTLTWNGGYYTQGGYLGSATYLATSYCTINLQGSYGSFSGNNATMSLNLSYAGWPTLGWISHYAKAANTNGIAMADWQYFGYWYLP